MNPPEELSADDPDIDQDAMAALLAELDARTE